MGRQYEETNPNPAAPNFRVGDTVFINRPCLWANCTGSVEAVYDKGPKAGLHRIEIIGRDKKEIFHCETWGCNLSSAGALPALDDALPELGEELPAL